MANKVSGLCTQAYKAAKRLQGLPDRKTYIIVLIKDGNRWDLSLMTEGAKIENLTPPHQR